jgi:hypothetical protein
MNKREKIDLLLKHAIELKNILDEEIKNPDNKEFDSSKFEGDKDLDGEIWKQTFTHYYASNYGRIKYKSDKGMIIPQRKQDGNLYLDREKWFKKCAENNIESIKISTEVLVYTYIAEAFNLNKEGYHIHHINRNGYDNRLENLLALPQWIHNHLCE